MPGIRIKYVGPLDFKVFRDYTFTRCITDDASGPTGTPGEIRKLSDGPDKGAVLVWAIPEGRSDYAWCWQIYPLAAYL